MNRFVMTIAAFFFSVSASAGEYMISSTPPMDNSVFQPTEGLRRVAEKLSFKGRDTSVKLPTASRASRWTRLKELKAAEEAAAIAAENAAIDVAVEEAMLVESCELAEEGKALFCKIYRMGEEKSPISSSYQDLFCPFGDGLKYKDCLVKLVGDGLRILDLYENDNSFVREEYKIFRVKAEIFLSKSLEGEDEVNRLKLFDSVIRTGDLINRTNTWGLGQDFGRVAQQQVLGGGTEN